MLFPLLYGNPNNEQLPLDNAELESGLYLFKDIVMGLVACT